VFAIYFIVNNESLFIDEKWLKDTYNKNNLEIINIIYGNWCGRDGSPDKTLQDIFAARKGY
jgi:hypothetical protein